MIIYKRGPESEPKSWRPITLEDCTAKVFFGIIADRLLIFLKKCSGLPPGQRAVVGVDGCADCNWILDLTRVKALLNQKNYYLIWLDLSNAFGSVNHSLLIKILRKKAIPQTIADVIEDAYTDGTVSYNSTDKISEMSEKIGLKQGCPLSPFLFDLYTAPVFEAVESLKGGFPLSKNETLGVFAFADDFTLIAVL